MGHLSIEPTPALMNYRRIPLISPPNLKQKKPPGYKPPPPPPPGLISGICSEITRKKRIFLARSKYHYVKKEYSIYTLFKHSVSDFLP